MRKLLFLLLMTFSAAGAAYAAPTPALPAMSAPSAANPLPAVTLGDVVSQADSTTAQLRDFASSLDSDQTLKTADDKLTVVTREIDTQLFDNARLLASTPSLPPLRTAQATWQALSSDLDLIKTSLSTRVSQLDQQISQLNDLNQKWASTITTAKAAVAPPDILTRINSVIATIGQTERATEAQRAQLFSAQNRVSGQLSRVTDALAVVARAQEGATSAWPPSLAMPF